MNEIDIPTITLLNQVVVYCPNKDMGCSHRMRLIEVEEHIA